MDAFACTEVTGRLQVGTQNEPSNIVNLDGLNALTSVGGNLDIRHNAALLNVDALAGLTSVGGILNVRFNPVLAECTVGLAELLLNDGVGAGIRDNAPGCNSIWEAMGGTIDAEDGTAEPLTPGLAPLYPNPARGAVTLGYALAEAGGSP